MNRGGYEKLLEGVFDRGSGNAGLRLAGAGGF
jgi:hypothetical protein